MVCANCKMILRDGATVCHICKTAVERPPTLVSRLGLDDASVRQGILITASVLIGVILLGVVGRDVLDNIDRQRNLDAAASRAEEERANDPTLPVAIGDYFKKVSDRCGRPDRINSSEDTRARWHFIDYKYTSAIPYDCVGSHTFRDFRLVSTYR